MRKGREIVSSVCTAIPYKMQSHLLNHLMETIKTFGSLLVLDSPVYEQLNDHIKATYRELFKRLAARMLETVRSLER